MKYFEYVQNMRILDTFARNWPFICNDHQIIKQYDRINILWRIEMNV